MKRIKLKKNTKLKRIKIFIIIIISAIIFALAQVEYVAKRVEKKLFTFAEIEVNKLSKGISEELKLDITNEEIRKLRLEINRLKKQVIKSNLEAQRYFDMLMEKVESDE